MNKPLLFLLFTVFALCSCGTEKGDQTAQQEPAEPTQNASAELLYETPGLAHCESAVYDAAKDLLYVSVQGADKPGDGSIATVALDGSLINAAFVTGLNNPKGIAQKGNLLYASDETMLVQIDLKQAKITARYPAEESIFLNDVCIDAQGNVYVSDMRKSSIYRLDTAGNFSEWHHSVDLDNPNGILMEDDHMLLAAWGRQKNDADTDAKGRLMKMNMQSRAIEHITPDILGNLDGIQIAADGKYLVSDWRAGTVYRVARSGEAELLIQTDKSVGDILYIADKSLLILPMKIQNKLMFYQL